MKYILALLILNLIGCVNSLEIEQQKLYRQIKRNVKVCYIIYNKQPDSYYKCIDDLWKIIENDN